MEMACPGQLGALPVGADRDDCAARRAPLDRVGERARRAGRLDHHVVAAGGGIHQARPEALACGTLAVVAR